MNTETQTHHATGTVWLRRLAVLTAVCTFPLIFVGGLVTSNGAALAVPDWPTTYGYNMFLFPVSKMVGGIFYEHSHRLLGSLVGMLTVALAAVAWRREPRRGVRWLAAVMLLMVIVQGVLGGLRVVLVDGRWAIAHAVLAQTFFCLAIAMTILTSPTVAAVYDRRNQYSLWPLSAATTAVIYGQLILGAVYRHTGLLLWAHIAGAVLALAAVAAVAFEVARERTDGRSLLAPAAVMLSLVTVQVAVGIWALVLRLARDADTQATTLEAAVPTLHVAIGALLLAASVVLSLRVWMRRPAPRSECVTRLEENVLAAVESEVNA
ncbi:MAG: COX15/CtaA family protein [Verrucomicrobia bacterium]|nr:COX15/CtaA family protein [Verrucomicrobiota bacterium]